MELVAPLYILRNFASLERERRGMDIVRQRAMEGEREGGIRYTHTHTDLSWHRVYQTVLFTVRSEQILVMSFKIK